MVVEAVVGLDAGLSWQELEGREWLVTNGRGDYAMGTVTGALRRSYHGLLVAAEQPPVRRRRLVSKLDVWIRLDGERRPLHPRSGHEFPLVEFHLDGTTPVWTYRVGDLVLEKRVTMAREAPITYVVHRVLEGGRADLEIEVLVDYQDHHQVTRAGTWAAEIDTIDRGVAIRPSEAPTPFFVLGHPTRVEPTADWVEGVELPAETRRGLADRTDLFHAATFEGSVEPGRPLTIVCSAVPDPPLAGAETAAVARELDLLRSARLPAGTPAWIRQLVLTADQFIVARDVPGTKEGRTVIAGYPWFTDWGRDTMIALPGLALATGRPGLAETVLRTFAGLVDLGMLPNHFPDPGQDPVYNTVDATLWFFEAVRQTWEATADRALVEDLLPVLEDIIGHHRAGTRYGIGIDRRDALLRAGEEGVQLTWMDAIVDDRVVTPRTGKPVEVNALWYQALSTMTTLIEAVGRDSSGYEHEAAQVRESFQRFWNPETGSLFDVIDGPDGDDPAIRPNQIFAVSLPDSPLSADQQRSVVEVVERELLTPFGLRSLSPSDPAYAGRYEGSRPARDAAYHQGTVWAWLIGPFATAVFRISGDAGRARSCLLPLQAHLSDHGLGGIAELFDGDPPHRPGGCPWQAWSVAEVLRAWRLLEGR